MFYEGILLICVFIRLIVIDFIIIYITYKLQIIYKFERLFENRSKNKYL